LIAIGVNWEGRRCVLAVEMSNRESQSSWKEFLNGLKERGLRGVEFVVSDHHAGLKAAIRELALARHLAALLRALLAQRLGLSPSQRG
jgi:putative transposase